MSESVDRDNHHLKTSDPLAGGSATVLEHPVANENGGPEDDARGPHRAGPADDCNSRGTKGSQWPKPESQEVCLARVVGNAHPKCPAAAQTRQEPSREAAAVDALPAHGNSGDGPGEETLSQVQGESGPHSIQRLSHGCPGGGLHTIPEARKGKKKHRRRPSKKKRPWKPYFKLSWEEKKALDERETARASRVRAEMFAKGLPVAPYNTTQFLMEEHDLEEPDLNTELGGRRPCGASRSEDTASEEEFVDAAEEEEDCSGGGSGGGSDGMGRPGDAGGEFLQRDFSETYEKYHVESLQNMTKQELVREYLELEKCMSRLEDENNRLRLRDGKSPDGTVDTPQPQPDPRLQELEKELERLRAQNSELRLQNELWRKERGHTVSTGE